MHNTPNLIYANYDATGLSFNSDQLVKYGYMFLTLLT